MITTLLFLLAGYIVVREIFFMYTTNKLINKLMSRNYHEYKAAETIDQKPVNQFIQPEDPMDMGALSEFTQ